MTAEHARTNESDDGTGGPVRCPNCDSAFEPKYEAAVRKYWGVPDEQEISADRIADMKAAVDAALEEQL